MRANDEDDGDKDMEEDAVDREDTDRQRRQQKQDEREDVVQGGGAFETVTASDGTKRAVKWMFLTRGGVRLAIPGGLFVEPLLHRDPPMEEDAVVSGGEKKKMHEKDGEDDDEDEAAEEKGTWIDDAWFPAAPLDENTLDEEIDAMQAQADDWKEDEEKEAADDDDDAKADAKDYVSDAVYDHLVSRVRVDPASRSKAEGTQRRRRRVRYSK